MTVAINKQGLSLDISRSSIPFMVAMALLVFVAHAAWAAKGTLDGIEGRIAAIETKLKIGQSTPHGKPIYTVSRKAKRH